MAKHPILEFAIRTRRIQPHPLFLLQQPLNDGVVGLDRAVLLGGSDREAAAVDCIHLNVDDLQLGGVENSFDHRQRVEF